MKTILFDQIIYGPVKSRRLGISLGINLLPTNRKYCNFDCVYCECGLNEDNADKKISLPSRKEVYDSLQNVLLQNNHKIGKPDVITFAGNGEPTMHPQFHLIIDDTIQLRDLYCKEASISVLSNSTMIHKKKVREALKKVDQYIMKLDSAIPDTLKIMNRPVGAFDLKKMILLLKEFSDKMVIQTMFLKGSIHGLPVDNTTDAELKAWVQTIHDIHPLKIMIYSIDRNTPFDTLEKIPEPQLQEIAQRIHKIGIPVQVYG